MMPPKKLKLYGPPGTGKTTKLMEYLEHEIDYGTQPNKIAFLTFTRAAREEALSRTGKTATDFPYLKTIHAICYHQLSISQDQIVRPSDLRSFGKKVGIKFTGSNSDPWIEEHEKSYESPTRDDILLQINHCGRHRKTNLKEALQQASSEIDYKYAVWLTKAYKNWKTTEGMIDYTDLLTQYLEEGESLDIDVMFVDEAQDLSSLQWEVVAKLGANAQRWYVCGDDDQAIFNWAGADSSVFQDLVADRIEVLSQSYRLSKAVHDTALTISSRIKNRIRKDYKPTESKGEVADVGHLRSLEFNEKTFVLFRNHYRGQELARQLKEEGTPFMGHGSPLLDIDVRACLMAWISMFKKKEIDSALVRKLLKYANKEFTQPYLRDRIKTHKEIPVDTIFLRKPLRHEWPKYLDGLPGQDVLSAFIRQNGFIRTATPHIELMSIHQSKGREAHTVVMDLEMSRATWESMLANPDDEHRVQYVGITRAKENLFFLLPDGNLSYKI